MTTLLAHIPLPRLSPLGVDLRLYVDLLGLDFDLLLLEIARSGKLGSAG